MKTIKTVDLINDFRRISDFLEANAREWVTVSRPHNKNIVIMTETEAHELAKARRNLEYMQKLDESIAQAELGKVVSYTREQMKAEVSPSS